LADKNYSKTNKISKKQDLENQQWLLEKYRLLAENSIDCIWTTDKNLVFTYVSPSLARILGFKPEEWIGTSLKSHVSEEEFRKGQKIIKKALEDYKNKNLKFITFETKAFNKRNQEVEIEVAGKILLDEKGEFIGFQGVTRDISQRKKIEKEVYISEERYRALFNTIGSCVAIYEAYQNGEDFIFRDVNKAAENLSQIKKEEVIGKKVTEIFPNIKEIGLFEIFRKVYKKGEIIHLPLVMYQDDRIHQWVENTVYKLPSGEIVAVYEDTSEQKKAEKALQESESKYRTIFENMASASCLDEVIYDNGKIVDYRILDVNPAYEELHGISRKKAIGSLASQLYGTGEAPYLDIYSQVVSTGKPASFETFFKPIQKHLYITASTPKPGLISIIATDITKLKETEQELRKLKDNLQQQVEEKTRQLQERVSELERFQKAAVDREFRIKALKEEIKRLNKDNPD